MTQFYSLFSVVYGPRKNSYDKELIGIEEVIKRYTKPNSPENILTNNILRVSNSPSEIYYCQPYLKDLFEAIKTLYLKQKHTVSYPLIFYRGASASL